MDSAWIKETIGSVLVKALAATVAAEPADPVEYLAQTLLKSVEAEKEIADYYVAKQLEEADAVKKEEEKELQAAELERRQKAQNAALEELRGLFATPLSLCETAASYVQARTAVGGAYVALLQPQPEREGSGDNVDPEAPADDAAPAEAEPEELPEIELAEGEQPPKFDWRNEHLLYVAATASARDLMYKALPRGKGVTYQAIVDTKNSTYGRGATELDLDNVLLNAGVHFFKGIPAVGAYLAVPAHVQAGKAETGEDLVELRGLLCADTLRDFDSGYFEAGADGKPLSAADKEFVRAVAAVLAEGIGSAEAALAAQKQERINILRPPLKEKAEGEEGEEAAPPPPPPPPAEEAAPPPPAAEGAAAAEGDAAIPNPVPALEAARERAYLALKEAVAALKASADKAIAELLLFTKAPQGTFRVLKAVQRVLFGASIIPYQTSYPQAVQRLEFVHMFKFFEEAIEGLEDPASRPKGLAENRKCITAALQGLNRELVKEESWFGPLGLEWVEALVALDEACLFLQEGIAAYAAALAAEKARLELVAREEAEAAAAKKKAEEEAAAAASAEATASAEAEAAAE